MTKNVCCIIVTYNTGAELLRCFDSIREQVKRVIIVDNGSDEETTSVLNDVEKAHSNVTIFYEQENLGIAAALNIGVKYALEKGYEWILMLDHDSEAKPGMVEKLLNAYDSLVSQHIDNIAIIGANLFDTNIKEYQYLQEMFRGSDIKEVTHALTSGSLINAGVFEKTGFFNELLFLYYVDDDFCLRCRNSGWRIYACRDAVLLHQEGRKEIRKFLWKRFVCRNYNHQAIYYISRNSIYMLKKYFKCHQYYNCYKIIKHLCSQAVQIILFAETRFELLDFMIKGIYDGIKGRYGKLVIE
jgi:rhamnosyltransferase